MVKGIKNKVIGISGSLSGLTSILGSWQVCHSACLGLITLLSLIGITLAGMPLLFLTKIALPFWLAAVALFIVTLYVYYRTKGISENLILMNSGLIITGTPFFQNIFAWGVGGTIVCVAIGRVIISKVKR